MTVQNSATLKSYFESGDRPTQAEFGDLVDTVVHGAVDVNRDHGAKGDDATNDTTAINAAFTATPVGGTCTFQEGTYLTDDNLTLRSDINLLGKGRGTIIKATTASGFLGRDGTKATRTALDANQDKGAITITLPSGEGANFSVGQWIGLESEDAGFGAVAATNRAGEEHKIMDITGDVLTLDSRLIFDYTTANSAEFWNASTNAIKNIAIKSLAFTTSDSSTISVRTLRLIDIHGLTLEDIYVFDAGGGIQIAGCHDVQATDIVVENLYHLGDSFSYGLYVSRHSSEVNIANFIARDTRHAFTTLSRSDGANFYGGPRNVTLTNCHGVNSNLTRESTQPLAIWDTHPYGKNIKFIGCTGDQGHAAAPVIQVRAHDVSLVDPTMIGGQRSIDIRPDSKGARCYGGASIDQADSGNAAIACSSGAFDALIDGMMILDPAGRGSSTGSDEVTIQNCVLVNPGVGGFRDQSTNGGTFRGNTAKAGALTPANAVAFENIKKICANNEIISDATLGGFDDFNLMFQGSTDGATFYGNTADGVPINDGGIIARTSFLTMDGASLRGAKITNEGATGAIEHNLPPAIKNNRYEFVRIATQLVRIDPDGTETIGAGGAGKYLQLDTDGAHVRLYCHVDGTWALETVTGTTSFEP